MRKSRKLDPRILPQMAVKVAFRDTAVAAAGAPLRLVIIPKAAIRNDGGRDFVFVIAGGRAERRAVTVANTQDAEATLSAGVAAGEKVALDFPPDLTDGANLKEKSL